MPTKKKLPFSAPKYNQNDVIVCKKNGGNYNTIIIGNIKEMRLTISKDGTKNNWFYRVDSEDKKMWHEEEDTFLLSDFKPRK